MSLARVLDMVRRLLKGNKGTEGPCNLVFVDTESWEAPHESRSSRKTLSLRLWCATRIRLDGGKVSRRIETSGHTQAEFWQFLDSVSDHYRCTWVFSHNSGFDLTMLGFWGELDNGRFVTTPKFRKDKSGKDTDQVSWRGRLCVDDRPFFCCVRNGDKHYKFVDSLNYYPMSLQQIGTSIGVPKLAMPSQEASEADWLDYCRRDVEILERAITGLIQTWRAEQSGVFQMTAAALAMTNFRHTCSLRANGGDDVDIYTQPGSFQNELEREAYYGGLVQPFYVGRRDHRVYHLDVNSLYPAVMLFNDFPRRFAATATQITPASLLEASRLYGCVAEVNIKSRHSAFPCRVNQRYYMLTGRYWTTLAGPELVRALETDSVIGVGLVQTYSLAPIFTNWVQYWYGRKLAAQQAKPRNEAEYQLAKMILNALSGKWAQKGKYWKDRHDRIALERWGGWVDADDETQVPIRMRGIAGNAQQYVTDDDPQHSFPAISAFITAHAREYMRMLIELCPERSVYYMATDSLICNQDAYDNLDRQGYISDTDIGSLKVVGIYDSADIKGCNHYILDGTETVSGLLGRATTRGDGVRVAQLWERTPQIIASGPRDYVTISEVPIRNEEPDYKGIIDQSGWWSPYRVSFDPDFTDRPPPGGYIFDGDWPTRLLWSETQSSRR